MTFGLIATNSNNQVLISSITRNLHLVQKVSSPTEVILSRDTFGGLRVLRYRITSQNIPIPFFTMPSTAEFYGCTRVLNVSGNTWDIEILKSGAAGNYPELYVFSDPRGMTATGTQGMRVYKADGTDAFDSRLRPLAVSGGLALTHPVNPKPSFPYGLNAKYCSSSESDQGGVFVPTEYNSYSISLPTKPMFFYPSMAQAERQATYSASESECDGASVKGNCIGVEREYYWNSTYWCFYRGGIKRGADLIQAGWMCADFGCNWNYSKDTTFGGIGVGGDSGSGGYWPYSNETINTSAATMIVGDASRYD